MSDYTKGPLMTYGKLIDDTTETAGGMYCIKTAVDTPRGGKVGGECVGFANTKADADLWSAAPDMFAAMRAIVFQVIQGSVLERDACITQARAAMAKATGATG